jgi:heme-degrading monooxygenase HmoA
MFASIRRYRLEAGARDEFARRVDRDFAEEISAQPGFLSYEFVDCGDDEVMTISVFWREEQAEASRDLARRWSDQRLGDFKFTRGETLRGEIPVSRAEQEMLEPSHIGATRKFASIRRYALRRGSVDDLVHLIDTVFADRIEGLDGFVAYHVVDCGGGEIVSISLLRDQATAEESDELALDFVRQDLSDFDIERTEVIGGEVIVSRAVTDVLVPGHA